MAKRGDEDDLLEQHDVYVRYLKMCLRNEDWHGVMDAAADLREIDAKLQVLEGE